MSALAHCDAEGSVEMPMSRARPLISARTRIASLLLTRLLQESVLGTCSLGLGGMSVLKHAEDALDLGLPRARKPAA